MQEVLKRNVPLSLITTIGLGGNANYYMSCTSADDIKYAMNYAKLNGLKVQVMAGGSNIIFSDEGFEGLVLKIDIKGISVTENDDHFLVNVSAGEIWDEFVQLIVNKGLAGIECLSGIPGSVGATPIQNVGAYGQEVMDTIISVNAIERNTLENISFTNAECNFGYRDSRFKTADQDKFIITEVIFRFDKNKDPEIKYDQLQKFIEAKNGSKSSGKNKVNVIDIREAVLDLRKSKSMVVDSSDPDSRSCGSFFMNPVLNKREFENLKEKTESQNEIPVYITGKFHKIPAAWLVEQAGFKKGYIKGGVGISNNHSLALKNINGTTNELLELAENIERKVMSEFGIQLKREPVIV